MLTVYTAGWVPKTPEDIAAVTTWREDLPVIEGVKWLLPRPPPNVRPENCGRPEFFLPSDIQMINRSDVMLAVLESDPGRPQFGTASEIGYAFGIGKPIIVACPDVDTMRRYVFAVGLAQSITSSVEEACDIISFMSSSMD